MSTHCAVHFDVLSLTTCKRCQRSCCEPCLGGVDLCIECIQREVKSVPPLGVFATLAAASLTVAALTFIGTALFIVTTWRSDGERMLMLGVAFTLAVLMSFVTAVTLAIFTHRAARHAIARRIDFDAETPFSAAVSWLIPILNLVRPFTLLRQLKRKTHDGTAGVDAWQGLWVAGLLMLNAPTFGDVIRLPGEWVIALGFVLLGSAGIVGAFVVNSLRRW